MSKSKGRSDFRLVTAPIYQAADWMADRDLAAKQSRQRACAKGATARAAKPVIGKVAVDIWAKLCPSSKKLE